MDDTGLDVVGWTPVGVPQRRHGGTGEDVWPRFVGSDVLSCVVGVPSGSGYTMVVSPCRGSFRLEVPVSWVL
jgi:hypothetical protein